MSIVQSLFFKPQRGFQEFNRTDKGEKTRGADGLYETTFYELDGVVREQHKNTIRLTKHPVEYGAQIVDHAIKEPYVITVEGIITNSPLLKQYGNKIPGMAGIGGTALNSLKGTRIQEAYKGLLEIQNKRYPLTLQTGLLVYENMVLTKVSTPNDLMNRLYLSMTFEEAITAEVDQFDATTFDITTATTTVDAVAIITGLAGLTLAGLTFLPED